MQYKITKLVDDNFSKFSEEEREDLVQEAFLFVLENKINVFSDEERVIEFLRGRIKDEENHHRGHISLSSPEIGTKSMEQFLNNTKSQEVIEDLKKAMEQFDYRTQFIVESIVIEGHTHQKVADILGISQQRVSTIYRKTLEKLKNELIS